MTKSARSPILGYNHNIRFHGRVFHVQTEDSGLQHARLFTHLFFEGTILASKKQEYDAEAPEDVVRLFMQRLHKAMIRELKEGVHDPRIAGFFAARGETIQLGDRPTLVSKSADGAASPPVVPRPVDDRPRAVSGSIDTAHPPARVASASPTPTPSPLPMKRVVVVKPPEIKRPPVVISSSAEGVVVRRNVVINVGGGTAPVQGQMSRGNAAPRPAVPYVVREGSYPLPTASRGSGPHAPAPATPLPPNRAAAGGAHAHVARSRGGHGSRRGPENGRGRARGYVPARARARLGRTRLLHRPVERQEPRRGHPRIPVGRRRVGAFGRGAV